MTLAGEAQSLRRDRSSGVNVLFAMLNWSHTGSPSSFACLLLKRSASSSNEWTPSTSSSISSNEASMQWSISTHILSWCRYTRALWPCLFMLFMAATTFILTNCSCKINSLSAYPQRENILCNPDRGLRSTSSFYALWSAIIACAVPRRELKEPFKESWSEFIHVTCYAVFAYLADFEASETFGEGQA